MSRTAAPVGEVTSAMRCGQGGMGFFCAGSNSPSACSRFLSCSNARLSAPAPAGITSEIYSCTCPVRGNELTRARTMTCRPFSSRNLSRMASDRNMTALMAAFSSLSVM